MPQHITKSEYLARLAEMMRAGATPGSLDPLDVVNSVLDAKVAAVAGRIRKLSDLIKELAAGSLDRMSHQSWTAEPPPPEPLNSLAQSMLNDLLAAYEREQVAQMERNDPLRKTATAVPKPAAPESCPAPAPESVEREMPMSERIWFCLTGEFAAALIIRSPHDDRQRSAKDIARLAADYTEAVLTEWNRRKAIG